MVWKLAIILSIFLVMNESFAKKKSRQKSQEESSTDNRGWLIPTEPKWSTSDDSDIKGFYKHHVAINQNEWQTHSKHADYLVNYIISKIQEEARSRPEISFRDFIRQGSSNEGLKVLSSDEFDVVLPFEFPGLQVKVNTDNIPPGFAEIQFEDVPSDFRKKYSKLFKKKKGKELLSTKYLHDTVFKSIFDKVLSKIKDTIKEEMQGKTTTYVIRRRSNAPSITLNTTITETKRSGPVKSTRISIDFIPGYVYDTDSKHPKLLVPKWIPESKHENMEKQFENTDTIWKISFYEYESRFIERSKVTRESDHLIAAFRILKGLKKADEIRNPSSQFASVLSTYHMKNILLYSLLFERKMDTNHQISSVTEALGCLISMIEVALHKKMLPKFFIGNPDLKDIFPTEELHTIAGNERMNMFDELSLTSLEQVRLDLRQAMRHFKLKNKSYSETALKFKEAFEKYIDRTEGQTVREEL